MSRPDPRPRPARPWSRTVPEGPWDAIVVGSGMGGMAAAALLSRIGRRVLVLEQHDVPGGFTHTFRRGGRGTGWTWDVGVHAVGEVTEHTVTGRVLADLARGGLPWHSLGSIYDTFSFPEGFSIDFPDNPRQFRETLVAAFPKEADGIDRYLQLTRVTGAAMKSYYITRILPRWTGPAEPLLARTATGLLRRTATGVLSEFIRDPHLRAVLCAQWGYHGATPDRASFAMQALVTRHFLHGAWYPRGGSGRIAEALLATVAEAGGATALTQDVAEILVEGGRARGVRLVDGTRIEAPLVISGAGIGATVQRLLAPPLCDAPWARSIASLTPGPAHVCLYLGFHGDIRTAGASSANRWFYETWDHVDAWHSGVGPEGVGRAPILYCSFPSLKDPEHDPGERQRHTGEVVTFVPWSHYSGWFDSRWKKRPEAYQRWKQAQHDTLLEHFLERMPGLRGMVAYSELSTPLTTDHFVRPQQGSIYGLLPTPERFANRGLRPASPIPGLYFAGAEVTNVGVVGAMMGGVLAALAAAPIDVLRHLRPIL